MFISYDWLKEFTDTKLSPQELRERLTMVGLAIDAVEQHDGDSVLDVEVPSNRPDCLSHVGIAREVAVIENGQHAIARQRAVQNRGPCRRVSPQLRSRIPICVRGTRRVLCAA